MRPLRESWAPDVVRTPTVSSVPLERESVDERDDRLIRIRIKDDPPKTLRAELDAASPHVQATGQPDDDENETARD